MAGQTNYSASKAGLIGFTKALAKEVGRRSVTVNALALGLIETDMTASLPEEDQDALYRLLKQRLKDTTLVSIGHRVSLAAHHARRLVWQGERLALA